MGARGGTRGTPLADMCQPGDVLCNSGHTALYVGNEVVRRRYPDSDCDVYEASYSTDTYPHLTHHGTYEGMTAYRHVGEPGRKAHPFINPWKLINGDADYVE